jgi:hypothetical protein
MKSFLFKEAILKAKLEALDKYGEAQTRRLIKPIPQKCVVRIIPSMSPSHWQSRLPVDMTALYPDTKPTDMLGGIHKSPYLPGEVVYFKESWRISHHVNGDACPCYRLDNKCQCGRSSLVSSMIFHWHSPLMMPEKYARTFCTITDVKPELFRVKDITSHDFNREGGQTSMDFLYDYDGRWVWRISFKRKE